MWRLLIECAVTTIAVYLAQKGLQLTDLEPPLCVTFIVWLALIVLWVYLYGRRRENAPAARGRKSDLPVLKRKRFTFWCSKWKPTDHQLALLLLLATSGERRTSYTQLAEQTGWCKDYVRNTVSSLAAKSFVDSDFDLSERESYAYIKVPGRDYLFRNNLMRPTGHLTPKATSLLLEQTRTQNVK